MSKIGEQLLLLLLSTYSFSYPIAQIGEQSFYNLGTSKYGTSGEVVLVVTQRDRCNSTLYAFLIALVPARIANPGRIP